MAEKTHPLARARMARGMTAVDLAREIRDAAERRGLRSGVDKQRVYKWETQGVTPDADSQIYIAEVFGVPAAAVDPRSWPNWLPGVGGMVVPLGQASPVPALREALRTTMERSSRRTFLTAISGSSLVTLASTWASPDSWAVTNDPELGTKAVGDEVVILLEETSARLATQATEQRQHTAPLVDALLTTVTDIIAGSRYSRSVKLRLHVLAASLSQTVGWHRFDYGLHAEASQYWIAGLHSAHTGGDRDMGAALLGDLAYQASWRDDPRTAAGILERALSGTRHPAAQSLLQLRLARALAAQGERRATLRALTAAEHLLDASSQEPVPAWCVWMSSADLAVDSGQALLDLGDTRRAHQLISEGRKLLPPSRDKTRGVFRAYEARSHLNLREPERAATAAMEALQVAQRIGAPRCVDLVRDLIPAFEAYSHAQGVGELLDQVAA
ncbi:helix-turn-helix transcriptional regulator [Streptomyces griseiscabiei]|uniref:Helix-turn-helix transcriptional regulator n=1 Tax=Streptomyces griseiscabiei TaxID=2993540 RepID=A0ABU4LK20_9ACTN|nr:helix-turn-helix transcriptional regulator [Streptomyces griseiscabiei]MBZ3906542.1 helix-turn-helix transcriptional regulator [Streptomyces griseiscabiei]MDX2916166.1 helix-turn-helix transcriptional regulator [Streptomyces griseiscabiei]